MGTSKKTELDGKKYTPEEISAMILSFGGISVHVQVLSQITNTNINYIYFFIPSFPSDKPLFVRQ